MSASARTKRITIRYGPTIVVVLALVGLGLIGGGAWLYANPSVETVTEQVNQQQISTSINHSAVVTTDNSTLYDKNELLQNLPVYFVDASPNLTITVETEVPEEPTVQVRHQLELHQQATREEQAFWEETTTLLDQQRNVTDGNMSSSTELNMSNEIESITQRENELGGVASISTELRLTVSYQTNLYTGEITDSTSLTFAGRAYWLNEDLAGSAAPSMPDEREIRNRNPLYRPLIVLGVVSLLLAAGVGYWYRTGPDLEALETGIAISQYDEWISEGEFPTGAQKQYIYINTLEDLVDVAIDTNKRVIHDPDFDAYAVLDGDLVYYYATDPTTINTWLDLDPTDGE